MNELGLPPYFYSSDLSFRNENTNIFSKLWIFAGLKSFLKKDQSFLTRNIAGVPIFLQNTSAGIKAFKNECPHRLSKIHCTTFGQKKMICPFHGWSFSSDGKLRGLPNEGLYNFNNQTRNSISLKEYAVEIVGDFIFVNLNPNPLTISEQFENKLLSEMADISSFFDTQIGYGTFMVNYNWKLNLEVIKDPNHIPFVHASSFLPILTYISKETMHSRYEPFSEDYSTDLTELSFSTGSAISDNEPWYRDYIYRYNNESIHYSWYLYPNTHFASVRGDYFFIQQYEPVSASQSRFHLWVMTAKRKNSKDDFTALIRALMAGERNVIEEDVNVLSNLQKNLLSAEQSALHGAYEKDIIKQNNWYRRNMKW